MLLWRPSTKIVQAFMIRQKPWPPGGRGLFFVYICIENFKILLVTYPMTNFNITWLECCFGDPLPRLYKQSWFIKKHGCHGVGLILPIQSTLVISNFTGPDTNVRVISSLRQPNCDVIGMTTVRLSVRQNVLGRHMYMAI